MTSECDLLLLPTSIASLALSTHAPCFFIHYKYCVFFFPPNLSECSVVRPTGNLSRVCSRNRLESFSAQSSVAAQRCSSLAFVSSRVAAPPSLGTHELALQMRPFPGWQLPLFRFFVTDRFARIAVTGRFVNRLNYSRSRGIFRIVHPARVRLIELSTLRALQFSSRPTQRLPVLYL